MGIKVFKVSDEEAEKAEAIVCVFAFETTPFNDNTFDFCAECGRGVQHRPDVPKGIPKICKLCAAIMIHVAQQEGDNVELVERVKRHH